jgi:C_GCAxxG_C_C family probable redox protein
MKEVITKERVVEQFQKGFDCSQVVLAYYAKELGITEKQARQIGAAFGGGMGIADTCGAVLGAMIVLGMKYGHCEEDKMEQKEVMNAKRAAFLKKFHQRYAGCACKQLLPYDISKPDEMQKVLDEGLLFEFCPRLVCEVIEMLECDEQ